MMKLTKDSIVKHCEPLLPHEHKFELIVNMKRGEIRYPNCTFAEALFSLETTLTYGQMSSESEVTSFRLCKVVRKEANEGYGIISSTLILSSDKAS